MRSARQVREFGMQGSPLANELGIGQRVGDFVTGDTAKMVAGYIANAIAGRLYRMHLDLGKLGENIGNVLEFRPIELEVLARREMPVASIVFAADACQGPELPGRQQAIGNRDPQHRRVLLDVQTVLQPERPEIVLRELAGEIPPRLIAKLRDTLVDEALVEAVVAIHDATIEELGIKEKESMAIRLLPAAI